MEDLRSSEALEKEVLEDARKKAERILKNANLQIAGLEKEWMEKKESEIALLNAEAGAKTALRQKEMDAAFPLEAQRRKLKFMNDVFEKFLSDFFEKLSAEDLEHVLEERGRCFVDFLKGYSVENEGLVRIAQKRDSDQSLPPELQERTASASPESPVPRKGKEAYSGFGTDAGKNPGLSVSYAGIPLQAAQRIVTSLLGSGAPPPSQGRGFRGLVFTGPAGAYCYRLTVGEITEELREYHRKPIMDALWKERN
ncbi:MAG: hypothetical protein LBK44_07130 [Spirochaetales bacterium]|jgi:hypothetical protein|nr:hypothetical protein [Spirochaetales bacterium]